MESLAYTVGLQYELNEKTLFPFYYQNKKKWRATKFIFNLKTLYL